MKRVYLIVLDSCGCGTCPDSARFGDEGANTLRSASLAKGFAVPRMREMGLFNIDGVEGDKVARPIGAYCRMQEASNGKDTTIGHWEIAGHISLRPLPTYPNGFPPEVIDAFERATGKGTLCNLPYSGTEVIKDYGRQAIAEDKLIVYTSADSVFQIAAHEDYVPVEELYRYCEIARNILQGEHGVGRVIARPFTGEWPYTRTTNRHDFSLQAPHNMLDDLLQAGHDTLGVGKIYDIFAGRGLSRFVRTKGNEDGMDKTLAYAADPSWEGLCFVNLVDTDMIYGHRRDIQGYGDALTAFDKRLDKLLTYLGDEDILFITADHGCDPGFKGTDHTREYVPLLVYGKGIKPLNLGTRQSFADVAATILDYFGLPALDGKSFLREVKA